MHYMRHRITLLALVLMASASALFAQQGGVAVELRVGNNNALGNYSALAVEARHNFNEDIALRGGFMYNTFGGVATQVRPAYYICDYDFGRLRVEGLLHYAFQSGTHSLAEGLGVGFDMPNLWASVGYYYRTMHHGGYDISERFNLFYELGVRCLADVERWDLDVVLSNCRSAELERSHQPSLYIDGRWYPNSRLGVALGVSYKPTGIFHISSDYYQIYTLVGLCYRW